MRWGRRTRKAEISTVNPYTTHSRGGGQNWRDLSTMSVISETTEGQRRSGEEKIKLNERTYDSSMTAKLRERMELSVTGAARVTSFLIFIPKNAKAWAVGMEKKKILEKEEKRLKKGKRTGMRTETSKHWSYNGKKKKGVQ